MTGCFFHDTFTIEVTMQFGGSEENWSASMLVDERIIIRVGKEQVLAWLHTSREGGRVLLVGAVRYSDKEPW